MNPVLVDACRWHSTNHQGRTDRFRSPWLESLENAQGRRATVRPAPAVQTRLGRDGVGGVGGEARRGAGTCMMQPLAQSERRAWEFFAVRLISRKFAI